MIIFLSILLVIYVLILIYVFFTLFICQGGGGSKLYCKIYERKDWKAWEKVVQNFNNIKFNEHLVFEEEPNLNNYKFELLIDNYIWTVKYWEITNTISVHDITGHSGLPYDCLSNFDKYHSNLVKKMLCEKFDFMREVVDSKTIQTSEIKLNHLK